MLPEKLSNFFASQNKLNELRDEQKVAKESITEIESALAKVKLANKLGCNTQELATVQIECPKEKLGAIIGKNGSMIKQISEKTRVSIDVHKETNKIDITGSPESVEKAKAEIDKISRSVETELEIPKDIHSYVTSRHVDILATLKEKFDDVYLDLPRSSSKAVIRGSPEEAESIKKAILSIEVVKEEISLTGREFSYLLGKKGATIDRLVSSHKVSIDVNKKDEDQASATIIGPPQAVADTLDEIKELMNDNREVSETITVDPIIKRILLADAGARIKAVQTEVNAALKELEANCFISFPREAEDKDSPELQVKARQAVVSKALELTEEALKETNALLISFTVDAYIVPSIIGKGGETIKKLTYGKPAFLEVDRTTGKVMLGATSPEERDLLHSEVKQIIDDNAIIRVDAVPGLLKAQFRELSRSDTKAKIQDLAWLDIDEEKNIFILRGKPDNLVSAKALLDEFISSNYIDKVSVLEEDKEVLMAGGKTGKTMKMFEDMGVALYSERNKNSVSIRGPREKVVEARKKLDQFLNGGDGHSVAKLTVTEQVVGAIIGKGGKTRTDLEAKYSPVSIHISKAFRVSIRGPEDKVNDCRVEILKMISSVRVNQVISVSDEEVSKLEKNGSVKRIMQETQAQISIADGKATIRGHYHDVRDAVSLFNEQITGEYVSSIELDASQFARVKATCRDPSHLQRMESATDAKVSLDNAAGLIQVSGKRNNVKRARDQVYAFLEFVCPGEICRLKLRKPLFASVGRASALASIAADVGGVTLFLDRDVSSIVVRDSDVAKVKAAAEVVGEKIKEGERLAYVLEISPNEAWLLAYIIGTKGGRIQALRKGSDCHIDVSREARTVTVVGESEESVSKVRQELDSLVEKGRRENVFITIPERALPEFIGKGGSKLKELSTKHSVEMQRVRNDAQFKISGQESQVTGAKEEIESWLTKWGESNAAVQMPIEKQYIASILGQNGVTARALQEEFGCILDIDRKALKVSVRGGTEEGRKNTLAKVQDIIDQQVKAKAEAAEKRANAEAAEKKASAESAALQVKENAAPQEADVKSKTAATTNGAATNGKASGNGRKEQFPSQPIGVQASKKNEKKGKKNGAAIEKGTEQGRNLFNLLVDDSGL